MKKVALLLVILLSFFKGFSRHVNSYNRQDGTHVSGYTTGSRGSSSNTGLFVGLGVMAVLFIVIASSKQKGGTSLSSPTNQFTFIKLSEFGQEWSDKTINTFNTGGLLEKMEYENWQSDEFLQKLGFAVNWAKVRKKEPCLDIIETNNCKHILYLDWLMQNIKMRQGILDGETCDSKDALEFFNLMIQEDEYILNQNPCWLTLLESKEVVTSITSLNNRYSIGTNGLRTSLGTLVPIAKTTKDVFVKKMECKAIVTNKNIYVIGLDKNRNLTIPLKKILTLSYDDDCIMLGRKTGATLMFQASLLYLSRSKGKAQEEVGLKLPTDDLRQFALMMMKATNQLEINN